MTRYRCPQCRQIHRRASRKAWIKTYCSVTGKNTRLIRQS